jgi:DNA (cytosine-5)-methyltransferase 1
MVSLGGRIGVTHQIISLFSGGGGIDCGLAAAGFETAVSLDMDEACTASLRANRCGEVLSDDIAHISSAQLLAAAGARPGDVALLAAGPPCQPFSKSANWHYGSPLGLDDPRSETLQHMMRIIEEVLPRAVVIENVPGFAGQGARAGVRAVEARLGKINRKHGVSYRLFAAIIDAADFGVPQHRRRLFIVLDREGRTFKMPRPTHGQDSSGRLAPYLTAWDAICDLRVKSTPPELQMRGRWAQLLPSIPEGENYLWHTDRGGGVPLFGYRTRYWSFLLKLAKARPAWTLSANPSQNSGPFHWKSRLLSVEEIGRLQSFPDTWIIAGSRSQRVRQLGNAVPPLLAEVIGREIHRQLLGANGKDRPPRLLLPSRGRPPAPERIRPVGADYLSLVGAHKPHPGHGRGPGARRRARELATQLAFL